MDWLGKDLWLTWVGIAVLLAIIEVMSLELVFLMLAVAALAAALVTWLGAPLWLALATFGAVAMAMLLLVRPRITARLHQGPTLARGQHGLIGHGAIVEETVTDVSGRVLIDGLSWTARPAEGSHEYAVGDRLVVTAIEGATARVARKDA